MFSKRAKLFCLSSFLTLSSTALAFAAYRSWQEEEAREARLDRIQAANNAANETGTTGPFWIWMTILTTGLSLGSIIGSGISCYRGIKSKPNALISDEENEDLDLERNSPSQSFSR